MRRPEPRTSLVGLATAVILSACGSPAATTDSSVTPGVSAVARTAAPTPVAVAVDPIVTSFIAVTQAPDRSMHMEAEGSVTFGGLEQTLTLGYDIDGSAHEGVTTIQSEMIGSWSVLTVLVGGRTFTNTDDRGWMLEYEESGQSGPKDPFGGLTTEDVLYIGPEGAAGARTHRLSLADPIGAFARAMGTSSAEALRDLDVHATTYEVKVDDLGRPLSAAFTMSGTSTGVGDISAALRYTFTNWGADFQIVAPIEVGPSPPPGTALTVYNRTNEPIIVRDAGGDEVAVPACDVAFASTFDTRLGYTILDLDGQVLAGDSPSSDQSWVASYLAFLPSGTMTSPNPIGELPPCGARQP